MDQSMQNLPDGFGDATMADVVELRKALDIGYSQPTTGTGFDALRVESLEQTLKVLTYSATHIRLWNAIDKQDAYSTVEEYNRLLSYGGDGGGFLSSGELPGTEDTTYERADQKVKYIGTTREVNHPSTLVRTVPPDLIATETANGALWMMGKLNRAMYYADATAIPLEFNSLTSQIIAGAGNVIDMRGQPLNKDAIENAAQLSVDNYGLITQFFSNPKVFTDFSKLHYAQQRFNQPGTAGNVGTPVKGYSTLSGDITFQPDVFVRKGDTAPSSATNAKAPAAPTVGTFVISTGVSGSLFGAADAGDYKYQVTAVNNYGESAPCALTAAQTVVSGGSIAFTITTGAGTYAETAYKIYRTQKGGSVAYYIGELLPRTKSGGVYQSTTAHTDINTYLPQTFMGLALDMTPQSLTFKQLSPMIKMPLAIIAPAIRWMQLLYGTPIVYAAKKSVVFRNIGVAS